MPYEYCPVMPQFTAVDELLLTATVGEDVGVMLAAGVR